MFDLDRKELMSSFRDLLMDTATTGIRAYRRQYRYDGLKLIGAAVGGCAVGVAVGMLLAPKRGDELRSDIANRAGMLKDKAVEKGNQIGSQIADKVSSANNPRVPHS
jgi:hypothetical protein